MTPYEAERLIANEVSAGARVLDACRRHPGAVRVLLKEAERPRIPLPAPKTCPACGLVGQAACPNPPACPRS